MKIINHEGVKTMTRDKKAYTLLANHDGIIAVTSNVKRAYEMAKDYIELGEDGKEAAESYNTVLKSLKRSNFAEVTTKGADELGADYGMNRVEIQKFYINN